MKKFRIAITPTAKRRRQFEELRGYIVNSQALGLNPLQIVNILAWNKPRRGWKKKFKKLLQKEITKN